MKNSVKSVLTLTIITVVAGVLLGYVYEITKQPIADQNYKTKMKAYEAVFPGADTYVESTEVNLDTAVSVLDAAGYSKESINECLAAVDSNKNVIGYVLSVTTSEGYGGDITISMGVTSDGVLNGIEILSIGETAGLGMKANTDEFKNQFRDKKVSAFTYTKTGATADYEIDAISGATITTNAMVNAVNAGLEYVRSISGGAANE